MSNLVQAMPLLWTVSTLPNSKKIRIVQYLAKENDKTEYTFHDSIYRRVKARQS